MALELGSHLGGIAEVRDAWRDVHCWAQCEQNGR